MQRRILNLFTFFVVSAFLVTGIFAQGGFDYPKAKKVNQVDNYHGTTVADPYRWLEDPDSTETKAWVDAQNKLTANYLRTIPQRTQIKQRLTKLWNYEKYSAPFTQGGKYFYYKNDGLQNQSLLYVAKSATDTGKVLLDPNKFSADGTTSLAGLSISNDGKMLAYGISVGGSDWREWRFMNIETGKRMKDVLKNIKFSGVSWAKDGEGVYYSRYPKPNEKTKLKDAVFNQKMYFHKIGQTQKRDKLIYERPDNKKLSVGGGETEDGRWLIVNVSDGTIRKWKVYYKDLLNKNSKLTPLEDKFGKLSMVGNIGATFFFRTDRDAPMGKVMSVNVLGGQKVWRDVIPEAKETLRGVTLLNNQFVLNYLKDAYTQIKIHDISGRFVRDVNLPGIGSAGGFGGKRYDKETFYSYSSYNTPPTIYRYNMETGQSSIFRRAKVDFDPNDYEVKQVFYESKDGTKVPMFIVHKKGITLDGSNPTLLYGYGGFNISMRPGFSVSRLAWMEMGGVYAVANLRGGGEYGEKWHKAGTKLQKQNVFDDFIAAAEYLKDKKYTSKKRLALRGGSNGGLLVGAVMTQRPDLFQVALPAVGVLDMLRYHTFTAGAGWAYDYGTSEQSKEMFEYIKAYSPLHNVKAGVEYPATMVTTGDHDDRVVPSHSFKFAAELQAKQAGNNPTLIRIETNAGHGAGTPTSKVIDLYADMFGFTLYNMGVKEL